MALMDTLKSLFGGNTDAGDPASKTSMESRPEERVEYKNCLISPTPIKEGGQFRTAGTISSQSEHEVRETQFIRADNHTSRDQAVEHCVTKAKQIIDERGDHLFDSERC